MRRPPRYRDSIKNEKPCLGDRKLGATPAKRIAPVFALMTLDRNRSEAAVRERQAIFLGQSNKASWEVRRPRAWLAQHRLHSGCDVGLAAGSDVAARRQCSRYLP